MKARLTGDFTELADIAKLLANTDDALKLVSRNMQEEALNLISEGFKRAEDPYGKAWDAPNNLQITGRLRSFARGESDAKGFRIFATDQKAIWHHNPQPRPNWGGKSLPRRLLVPIRTKGLPPEWTARLKDAAREALEVFQDG